MTLLAVAFWTLFVGADTLEVQNVQEMKPYASASDCDRAGQVWQYNAKRSYVCKEEKR
jgi:hypothetical protein